MTGLESEFDTDRENLSPTVEVIDFTELGSSSLTQPEIASYNSADEQLVQKVSMGSTTYLTSDTAITSCPSTLEKLITVSTSSSKDNSFTASELKCTSSHMETSAASSSFIKENSAVANWSKYIPSQLRTPKSAPLRTKQSTKNIKDNMSKCSSQSQLSHKVVTWASTKADIANEHLKLLKEEHALKLKLLREKHEWEMAMAKEEAEERRRYFVQKSELELEILRQQLKN